jgi:hypothetical protein
LSSNFWNYLTYWGNTASGWEHHRLTKVNPVGGLTTNNSESSTPNNSELHNQVPEPRVLFSELFGAANS